MHPTPEPIRLPEPIRRRRAMGALPTSALLTLALLTGSAVPTTAQEPRLTLMTHDSFSLPAEVFDAFEEAHGVDLVLLPAGDAGSMLNQAILTAERPLADVLFGVDSTFLSRALEADLFLPYESPALEHVPADLVLDPGHRVTPMDFGHVCLNIDRSAYAEGGAPASLEDLTKPEYRGHLVVENPATSSPGLAFLLATVALFGDDPETGWQAFWRDLRANDVAVAAGWEEAYYGSFSGGAGEGDRPIVVSYASSPAAEVVFGPDPEADESPTMALDSGCYTQIEFAGILRGSEQPELAGALIDHLLSPEVQAEIPLAMYVYPARSDADVPEVFERFALIPSQPLSLPPDVVDARRDELIGTWTDIVLR